jgi:hypothetical protein
MVETRYRPATAFPPETWFFGLVLALITLLYLAVSHLALAALGINYETPGGNPLEKIHPATFLMSMALVAAGLLRRKPIEDALAGLWTSPGTTALLVCSAYLVFHTMFVVGLPFTGIIDALAAPAIAYFLFSGISSERAQRLAWIIHLMVFANALLAIAEFTLGFRMTPLVALDMPLEADWRSTAFFGHPLANASIAGMYLLAMALGAGRGIPLPLRWLFISAASVSMVTFGGRAATVLLIALVSVALLVKLFRLLNGENFARQSLLAVLLVIPATAIAALIMVEAGFLEQFLARFTDDDGSAATRVDMLELFAYLSWYELLIAPDPSYVASLQSLYRLDFGIESFWVAMVLMYGLLPSLSIFAAIIWFCRDIVKAAGRRAIWLLVFVFGVASASTSLSSKSTLLTVTVIFAMVLMRSQMQAVARESGLSPILRRRSLTV